MQAQSKRKPHNNIPGYVCELRSKHPKLPGHIVILDRDNGADDIDADERWLVAHMAGDALGCFVAVRNQAIARDLMKATAAGGNDVDLGQHCGYALRIAQEATSI